MSKFNFITDVKSEAFCLSIAHIMVERFGISEEEAIGRINKQLQNVKEWTGEKHLYYHQIDDDWANDIYYEEEAPWWIQGSNPKPKLYP